MFGLCQQICSHPDGIGLGIGNHEHLTRTGQKIDANAAKDLTLGLHDIGVSGTEEFGDSRDAFRSIGQGGDRLGSADTIDFRRPAEVEGGEKSGGHGAIGTGGSDSDDFRDSRRLGEPAGHDGAGDQGGRASGDIEADAGKGIKAFAYQCPLTVLHRPVFAEACLGKGSHIFP